MMVPPMFPRLLRLVVVFVLVAGGLAGCRLWRSPLSISQAEASLRSSPEFTTRPGSAIGRELVEITVMRRIGTHSIEVEFTWHDTVPAAGQAQAPLRTSMALFREREDRTWTLASLYKVN
jgi:hypothetical protein